MKNIFEKIINQALEQGASFVEIFMEDTKNVIYQYLNSKLYKRNINYVKGIGIRIFYQNEVYYGSTSNISEENLSSLVKKLCFLFNSSPKAPIKLPSLKTLTTKVEISHEDFLESEKLNLLKTADKLIRDSSPLITQNEMSLKEIDKIITIANSDGQYIEEKRAFTSLSNTVYAANEETKGRLNTGFSGNGGYEIIKKVDLENEYHNLVKNVIALLSAKESPKGEMPIIIANGFGAVIFHEACGHALEAENISKNIGTLVGKKETKIASSKVTLIDDGSIDSLFGTTKMDDEGHETRKNILIENGILKNYMVDYATKDIMKQKLTGSGRRESYHYASTSRMTNTYLKEGTDKIEDMIKSIDFGLYCYIMNGGMVKLATGDFNFTVTCARVIRNGKLEEYVKDVSLIGNTKDILKEVSMVADDLTHAPGYCNATSGIIYVTVGQPTIKVNKILVGGKGN
ncbi:MAG: TldD/PmbA family protein [Bacilli bacterium]